MGTATTALRIFQNPQAELETFVKIFGRCDGKMSWSAAKGSLFLNRPGNLPEKIYPFISIRAHTFTRHQDGFIEDLLAAILVTKPCGSTLLEAHTTRDGTVHDIRPFPYRQSYFHCPNSGTHRVDAETRDVTLASIWSAGHLAPFSLEWSAASGIGWANYVNPHERMGGTWSDCYRFRFDLSDLNEDDRAFIPSTYGYVGESPAPPWLGENGAQALWQAWGAKFENPDDIPEDIRGLAVAAIPDLTNPNLFSKKQ